MAVGSRSQSARTYLEKHLEDFADCETDELIKHGLRALRDTLPNEVELTTKVTSSSLLYSYSQNLIVQEIN
jgi:20S proteasome subunit alpha 6